MRVVAEQCKRGECPTVWEDGADLVIQGYVSDTDGGTVVPAGEAVIRVPRALILEAAARLAREAAC